MKDINYGILRICPEFWKKIRKKKVLSEELGASKETIHRQTKTFGKSHRSFRFVPHELTPQQPERRVHICPMDDRFIRRIVTCGKNGSITATLTPRTPQNSGSIPVNLPKPQLKNRCVWLNFEGVIHWEFVPNGRAVDANLYPQLERVYEILSGTVAG